MLFCNVKGLGLSFTFGEMSALLHSLTSARVNKERYTDFNLTDLIL